MPLRGKPRRPLQRCAAFSLRRGRPSALTGGKGLQATLQIGTAAARAFRQQAHPPMTFGKQIQHQTGFTVRPPMQDESALPAVHGSLLQIVNIARSCAARSSSAQPDFTFTHSSRCTLASNICSMSARFDADGFDLGAFVADDHFLLAFALDRDQAVHIVAAAIVSHELFDFHRHRIRQLFARGNASASRG